MNTIRVHVPVAESKVAQSAPLGLPSDLAGATIGFLDNNKANFALLAREMEDLLRARYPVQAVVHARKANTARPAPPEVLATLAGVGLVVTGSAD